MPGARCRERDAGSAMLGARYGERDAGSAMRGACGREEAARAAQAAWRAGLCEEDRETVRVLNQLCLSHLTPYIYVLSAREGHLARASW